MGCSERQKEIKRRRKRREKLTKLKASVAKASASDKAEIVRKVRAISPVGAATLIKNWGLESV